MDFINYWWISETLIELPGFSFLWVILYLFKEFPVNSFSLSNLKFLHPNSMKRIWFLLLLACSLNSISHSQLNKIGGNSNIYSAPSGKSAVTDVDGNGYSTIKIGTQTWMAENLRTSRYNDATPILKVNKESAWNIPNTGAYCWYNDDSLSHNSTYGKLYNGYTVVTNHLCPSGWHVPSDYEWSVLFNHVSGDIIGSGFDPLTGGLLDIGSKYMNEGVWGYWWSSTRYNDGNNYLFGNAISATGNISSSLGLYTRDYNSVRCIKDTVEDALFAWYPFDGNAKDATGNGKDGTVQNAELCDDRFSQDSSAYLFAEEGDKIVVEDFNLPPVFTISFWVKCDSTSGRRIIFSKNYNILVKSQDNFYTCEFHTSSSHRYFESAAGFNRISTNPSKYDFIVLKYDSRKFSFYVNNTLVGSSWAYGEMSYQSYPVLMFGGKDEYLQYDSQFYGKLDDIRIFGKPLSNDEIDSLYWIGNYPSPYPSVHLDVDVISQSSAYARTSYGYPGKTPVIKKGICWDVHPQPDTTDQKFFVNDMSAFFVKGLNPGTQYYIRAFAINNEGIGYSNEIEFRTLPSIDYGSVSDIDGNNYKTVKIGRYTWMAENLKTTHYGDGSEIPYVAGDMEWGNLNSGAYCWYNNDTINQKIYGGLYNYYAVTDAKHLCPANWHVPGAEEFATLPRCTCCHKINSIADEYDCKIKEPLDEHWVNPDGTNETGFTALPGGVRQGLDYEEMNPLGTFKAIGFVGYFWKSSGGELGLASDNEIADVEWLFSRTPKNGYSVRCVMDEPRIFTNRQVVHQNSTFEWPIYVSHLQTDQVLAYQFELDFDDRVLQFENFATKGTMSQDGSIQVNQSGHKLSVAWAHDSPLADTGKLITLKFKALSLDTVVPALSHFLVNTDSVYQITSGQIEIVPAFGDIDANGSVQAYDAALDLEHSAGLDPLPEEDPLPWNDWRFKIADVDQDNRITAYDASLILQYTVSSIDSLPPSGQSRTGNPEAHTDAYFDHGYIVLKAANEFHGLNVEMEGNHNLEDEPQILGTNVLSSVNISSGKYALALASYHGFAKGAEIMKIPVDSGNRGPIVLNILADKVADRIVLMLPTSTGGLLDNSVEIYPNPVVQRLFFRNLKGEAMINIYDLQGRKVRTCIVSGYTDIGELENGMYMIEIINHGETIFRKILKQ